MFGGNLLGNICGKPTTTNLFPYQDEKEGVTHISQKELTACMRQRRTSWDVGAWRVQVADIIDVALQKAKCLQEQWLVPRSMSESCISVSTSGKYVAYFFCQGGIKTYRSLGL